MRSCRSSGPAEDGLSGFLTDSAAVTGFRRQLSLLGTAPGFRLLFLATLGSSLGTLLATVALVVDIKDRTNSGSWVSALMIAEFLPAVAVGLFLGPLLDRVSRRGLMIVSDLVRAAVFCTLPFASSAGQIVALAGIAGLATGFFRPAVYAGLPNLVEEEELARANSLIQTSENVSWAVAPVIGGALVAASGPDLAYWLNGASFLVSALLLLRLSADKLQGALGVSRGHLRDLRDGFARVLQTRSAADGARGLDDRPRSRRFDADRAGVSCERLVRCR